MESIDRLRQAADELAQRAMPCSNAPDYADVRWKVKQLADAIEREVDDMWHALTIDMKPMTDENMAESGWVRLPKDADGEYIHVGDKAYGDHYEDGTVTGIQFYETANGGIRTLIAVRPDGWDVPTWHTPDEYRHHHEPTVEDVLREMLDAWGELPSNATNEAIVAEYAAKLRLAGDAE